VDFADAVNGGFELFGTFLILLNIRQVIKDKSVAGVNPWAVFGFGLWGLWNLFYYPHLGQWWSFGCGVSLTLTNLFWWLLLYFYSKEKK